MSKLSRRGEPWAEWENAFLRQHIPTSRTADVAAALRRPVSSVYQQAARIGVRKDPAFVRETSRATTLARSPFTPEIAEIVELMYPDTRSQDISELIGIPFARIQAYAKKHGWKKLPECLSAWGRERAADPSHPMHRAGFKKGHVPANKGMKGWEAGGRSAETRFRKGQRPHTWKPIGSYRVNADGYLDRKVSDTGYPPDDWKPVHRLVWIEAYGEIPAGHVVRFKPGMKTTEPELITVDRLECITLRENAMRNAWHSNLSPELRQVMGARVALTRAINRRQRELQEAVNE